MLRLLIAVLVVLGLPAVVWAQEAPTTQPDVSTLPTQFVLLMQVVALFLAVVMQRVKSVVLDTTPKWVTPVASTIAGVIIAWLAADAFSLDVNYAAKILAGIGAGIEAGGIRAAGKALNIAK